MSNLISTLGIELLNISNLTDGQTRLGLLNQQLASGVKSKNLADYSASEAKLLMNLNNAITARQSFLDAAKTISARLKVYDQSLTAIENTASLANTALLSSTTYNPEQNASLAEQIKGYMQQVSYYLNQKVGDRYIFAGTRYGTAPVTDITTLPVPPTETSPYVTSGYILPSYDSDYDPSNPGKSLPAAYAKDQVSIDTTQKLTYGVNSNEEGFQKLIMGLRWAYAATQDQTNYSSYMTTARDLITSGLNAIRGIHAGVSSSNSTLEQTKTLHTDLIEGLKSQIDDIQNVDITEVAVKINTYHSQLEASYAATAKMTNLSVLKYL